ncbi:RNA polymerase sigma factor [Poriferisphaera sp. WC338]|uniref:RNA polymerase sigma factor n=1 Tax=Poriferisphaera sp. WC338 TaxID=3425129 RepID=UPI003D8152BB
MGTSAPQPQSPDVALDQMLQQAAAGDGSAWSSLVRRYTPRVMGLLFKSCTDRELAEELTQDTFVTVAQKLLEGKGYDERGRFESWLFRIAMNRLRDEMRRRKRQAKPTDMSPGAAAREETGHVGWAGDENSILMGGPSQSPRPEEVISRNEQIAQLQVAVSKLNEADREVIYLRHTAGLSFAQIAESLGQPLGTVLARSHRALKKLREIMETKEPEP